MADQTDRDKLTRSDFLSWLKNPVTQLFLQETVDVMDNQLVKLINSAGKDSLDDRWTTGFIYGLRQLADWDPNLRTEEVDIDGFNS